MQPFLYVHAESIDHAAALFTSFDRYRGKAFADFESAFRRQLVTAFSGDVARSLSTKLSFDATQGDALPTDATAALAEVTQLGSLLTKIGTLVPFLQSGNPAFARELTTALSDEASDALQRDKVQTLRPRRSAYAWGSMHSVSGDSSPVSSERERSISAGTARAGASWSPFRQKPPSKQRSA